MRTSPLTRYPLLPALFFFFFLGCKKDNNAVTPRPPVVDAGSAQTIKLPLDSVMLTGSAKAVDARVVAYEWSEVSGPNIPAIVSPGLPATEVRGLMAGTYIFQLFAVDSLGNTGVDTLSITVKPLNIITLSLNPTPNSTEALIWGDGTVGLDESGNASPELDAAAWTSGSVTVGERGAVQFDFSSIPSTATIISAKLTLFSNPTPQNGDLIHANYGTNNAMFIQQITSAWNAATVKWYNQPSSTTVGEVSIPSTAQAILDLPDIDVTALVKAMVQSNANYGFLLKLQNETYYNSRIFCSSRYSDASKHPKIVIQYGL